MNTGSAHLSERDLVMAADGELPARRRAEVSAHLEACWNCRERMSSLQSAITDFVRARNAALDAEIPVAGPTALLRARLAEASEMHAPRTRPAWGRLALAGAAFLGLFAAIVLVSESTVNAEGPKPRYGLTPGETRPITLEQVCSDPAAEVVSHNIPENVREKVFATYGIDSSRRDQFEVDYLITPDLGGSDSIRNLWPQPYTVRWNARVKDKLEQRLHELVCSRQMDLATAQHDIATDWIGAYRRYVGAR